MAGIYIHIPFCKKACHYCNFHFSTSLQQKPALLEALVKEIAIAPLFAASGITETIYFGGGTPSLLSQADLQMLLSAVRQKFFLSADAEITLEANPDDITPAALAGWLALGINRLSIGIQSFQAAELQWMNRAHNQQQALACIDMARAAGFQNFSADLIYGSPLLSDADWQRNVETVIAKEVPHISCYALTVEPHTALDKQIMLGKKAPVDAERQAAQFTLLMEWMESAGYEHYEISNFALPGQHSRHNSSYWQGKPYYGFGPAAHGYNGQGRRWNVANNVQYIQALMQGHIPAEEEILTIEQQLNERVMIELRTAAGLNLAVLEERFGQLQRLRIERQSALHQRRGHLIHQNNRLILTRQGKLFADGIAADLFV